MPRCRHCGTAHQVDDLVRHEERGLLIVHCPSCKRWMGTYRERIARR